MIIQCDQCSARFRLDDNKITESGVKVRCKRCQHIFLVRKELPQEEPDLDALLGLQPETSLSLAIPAQETAPSPEPPSPAPEPARTESDFSQFFLQTEQTVAAPPEEPPPAPAAEPDRSEGDFSQFFLQTEQPVAAPPEDTPPALRDTDEFSFAISPATDLIEAGLTSAETAPPEDSFSVSPQINEDFGFMFAEEAPVEVTVKVPSLPEPDVEAVAQEEGWNEFEVEISSPQSVVIEEAAETDAGVTPVAADEMKPEEKPESPGWEGFDSFEIELPEPVVPPEEIVFEQEPVPGETVSIPIPALPAEPAEEDPFDFSGWSPEDTGAATATSPPPPESTESGEPLPSSLTEGFTFSSSAETAPIPPVVPEAPFLAGAPARPFTLPEFREKELPETPGTPSPPAGGENITGDTIIFADEEPPFPTPRRQGPSLIAVVGMLLAALMVLIVGGIGALYLLKGPEALKKVGLGSMARMLGSEKTITERILIKSLEGSYVNNIEAGELFVIRGEAANSFKTPRAAIQVRGLIYNAAGTVILKKTTFCGNPLTQEQLVTLPIAKIEEAMNNRLGDSYANIGVPAGKSVPFAIVFSGLPKEAVDFGVEVAGSQAAGQ